jgi:hypothetical protein
VRGVLHSVLGVCTFAKKRYIIPMFNEIMLNFKSPSMAVMDNSVSVEGTNVVTY